MPESTPSVPCLPARFEARKRHAVVGRSGKLSASAFRDAVVTWVNGRSVGRFRDRDSLSSAAAVTLLRLGSS